MPHLAARRWHTLRRPHAAICALCRPLRAPRLAFTAPLRAYAQQSASRSSTLPAIRPLNSAIIIPASVKDAQPDDLVNLINPIASDKVAQDTFCVLLVTPSFAHLLLNDDLLLAKAIRRAYGNAFTEAPGRLTIQALSAVVDKLPAGRALKTDDSLNSQVVRRALEPPVGDTGYEGIAFVTLPATATLPSTSPKSPDKGAIDFVLSGQTTKGSTFHDTWRLPLANTVFQTGSPTTMHLSTWGLLSERRSLGREQKMEISHHGIGLTVANEVAARPLSVLSIPLQPLTLPRKVEGCMGNIIRRVVGQNGESITASSELEKVVPQFFEARTEPPQPTTAWALVLPRSLGQTLRQQTIGVLSRHESTKEKTEHVREELWERMWRSDPTEWNKLVPRALAKGARLHRVLSGGGGWGKKAGLLSLDPVPVSDEIPIRMEDATSGFDGPGDFSTALTPVVQDGDAIQFYIAPKPINTVDIQEHDELVKLESIPKDNTCGWELGTIPSTVDSIPGGSWQHDSSNSKYVAVFRRSFGFLTEGGMTLTRRLFVAPGQPLSTLTTSTIDVPYSRFWTVELADNQASAQDKASNPRRTVSAQNRSPLSSAAASIAVDRIEQTITRLTDEHARIMHTLSIRTRRVKARKVRRAENKYPGSRSLHITTGDITENSSFLGKLEASDKPVVESAARRGRGLISEESEGVQQLRIRRRYSQPRRRPPINIDGLAEKVHWQGKGIKRLADQVQIHVLEIRRRIAEATYVAPIRMFVSKDKPLAARSFYKEHSSLRSIEKDINRLVIQFRNIAFKLRVRKREQIEWRKVPLEKSTPHQNLKHSVDPVARLSKIANVTAAKIYDFHTSLRFHIETMISHRLKARTQASGVRTLRSKRLALRAYDEVLFYDRPEVPQEHIRDVLRDTQLQNYFRRLLVINTPQGIAARRQSLEAEQRALMLRRERERKVSRSGLRHLPARLQERRHVVESGRRAIVEQNRKSIHESRVRRLRSSLAIRKHVTVPPYWRRKGIRDHKEFRTFPVGSPARRERLKLTRRMSGKKRSAKSTDIMNTVASWLG